MKIFERSGPRETFPRFALNPDEMSRLMAAFLSDGRFMSLTEEEGREMLMHFVSLTEVSPRKVIDAVFLKMQNVLMALRKDDFETIQREPPFSPTARHNLRRLTWSYRKRGEEGFVRAWEELFAPGWEARKTPNPIVTWECEPIDTRETVLRFVAPTQHLAVTALYWYIYYHHGREWKVFYRKLLEQDRFGRQYDYMAIKTTEGEFHKFYLDVTEWFVH